MHTDSLRHIFDYNKDWIASKLEENPEYFDRLNEPQNPDILYIGCSDSRVPANEILGLGLGDIFVHRNIANMVITTDLNVLSVLHFAINILNVKHIVVCGHYNCGGVAAAMKAKDMGMLNPWLRNIRDVFRLHKKELRAIEDESARYNRLVELNVQEQCVNIMKTAALQQSFLETGYPLVHGWVFDLKSGKLIDLQLDLDVILHEIQEIYDLTGVSKIKY